MKKGQLSVEFFLILAIVMAMISMLLANALEQMKYIRQLDAAALAKSCADTVSGVVNYAKLGGAGTSITRDVFVPKDMVCFLNAGRESYCLQKESGKKVYGDQFLSPDVSFEEDCYSSGWIRFTAFNDAPLKTIKVTCQTIS